MSDKKHLLSPDYLRDLNDFITKFWKEIPKNGDIQNGKYFQKFKHTKDLLNTKNEDKTTGWDKNQYSQYVNRRGDPNPEKIKKIQKQLEFIVFDVFEKKLGEGAFDKWCQNKNSDKKVSLPNKTFKNCASENIEEKNNEVIEILISNDSFTFDETKISYQHAWQLTVEVFIQNFGSRPIVFKECRIMFEAKMITDSMGQFYFNLKQYQMDDKTFDTRNRELVNPIIINGNDVKYVNFVFVSTPVNEGFLLLLKPSFSMGGPFSSQVELLSNRNESYKSNKIKACR